MAAEGGKPPNLAQGYVQRTSEGHRKAWQVRVLFLPTISESGVASHCRAARAWNKKGKHCVDKFILYFPSYTVCVLISIVLLGHDSTDCKWNYRMLRTGGSWWCDDSYVSFLAPLLSPFSGWRDKPRVSFVNLDTHETSCSSGDHVWAEWGLKCPSDETKVNDHNKSPKRWLIAIRFTGAWRPK